MSFSRRTVLALLGLAPAAAIANKLPVGAEVPVHVTDVMPEPWLGTPSSILNQSTKADVEGLMDLRRQPIIFRRITVDGPEALSFR